MADSPDRVRFKAPLGLPPALATDRRSARRPLAGPTHRIDPAPAGNRPPGVAPAERLPRPASLAGPGDGNCKGPDRSPSRAGWPAAPTGFSLPTKSGPPTRPSSLWWGPTATSNRSPIRCNHTEKIQTNEQPFAWKTPDSTIGKLIAIIQCSKQALTRGSARPCQGMSRSVPMLRHL